MAKVELIPSLCAGTDLDVVNAARRSFDVQKDDFGASDARLIAFLAREGHFLPFRHVQLSFAFDAAIPVARQLGKHQTGLNWSERSMRYLSKGIEVERIRQWRAAPVGDRKQGSGEPVPPRIQRELAELQERSIAEAVRAYDDALALGACPEQARFLLPQGMIVRWTWTGTLLAFAHIWKLRHHKDTQAETREVVEAIDGPVRERLPVSWPALREFYAGH